MTKKQYDALVSASEKAGACPDAIAWLRAKKRTAAQLVEYNRGWTAALAAAGE